MTRNEERALHYNWGFHDGTSARSRSRWPEWCRSWQNMHRVHFDRDYGAGFSEGWYGNPVDAAHHITARAARYRSHQTL